MKGRDGLKITSPLINSKALFVTSYYQNRPSSSKRQKLLYIRVRVSRVEKAGPDQMFIFGDDSDALWVKHISPTVKKLLRQICDFRYFNRCYATAEIKIYIYIYIKTESFNQRGHCISNFCKGPW